MVQMEIDREILLIVPFSLGAMISVGLIPGDVLSFFDFSEVVVELGGQGIAWSHLVSLLSLTAVVVNRDESVRDQLRGLGAVEAWVVYATMALVIAPPFLPALESIVTEQPASVVSVLVQTMGFTLVSYIN